MHDFVPSPVRQQPQAITKQTVFLVVDDFEPMRKVTSGQLRAMGASAILTANNGADALRILKKQRVDIVLSDWNMPMMTGLQLLKAVRADDKLIHLPFIMITAEAERHRIEDAIASGVNDFLVKPYTADRLAAHIEKSLTSRPRPTQPVPAATPASAPPAVAQGVRDSWRPTILIVDDTPDNLMLL
ncbi:MAG: response regulator, partial [Gallionellaceae bacterium]|nr:response regulator [Gallionellaceae bacterium]